VRAGESEPGEMEFEEFKTLVLDPSISLSIENVAIIGGEPFMKSDLLLKVVKYCKSKGLKVFIGTNGTLITENIASELKRMGVDSIWITIYGVKEKTHEFITQTPSSFKKMLRGLKILSETGINIGIQLVPMKPTWREQPLIVDLVKRYGVEKIEIFRVAPVGRAIDNWGKLLLTKEETHKLEEELIAKVKETEMIIAPAGFATMQTFPRLSKFNEEEVICGSYVSCTAGIRKFYVTAVGNVYPCAALENPYCLAGNIKKNNLINIWCKSPIFQLLRYYLNNPPPPCNTCKKFNICNGDCRSQVFFLTGLLTVPTPECPKVKSGGKKYEKRFICSL